MELTQLQDLAPERWMIRVLWGAARDRPNEIRELVPVMVAAADAYDQRTAAEEAQAAATLHGADPANVVGVAAWVDDLFTETERRLDALDHDAIDAAVGALDPLEVATDPFSAAVPFIASAMPYIDPGTLAAVVRGVPDLEVAAAYMASHHRTPRAAVVRRALFVTAMAEIEPHMGHLLPYLMVDTHPGKYTGLGDPKLARAVRKAGYGGPAEWKNHLVDKLGLDKLESTIPWKHLEDAWDDRNALHHRRGYVDKAEAVAAGIPVDTSADITTAYLNDTIDHVQITMLALVLAASDRLGTGDLEHLVPFTVHGFASAYRAERWGLALGFATIRREHAPDFEEYENGRVEQWLARSGAEGPAAVRAEVAEWDCTQLDPVYGIARDLLLGENATALAKLNRLRSDGGISDGMIEDSVVFDPIRADL